MFRSIFATLVLLLVSAAPICAQTSPPDVRLETVIAWDDSAECAAPAVCTYEVSLDGIVQGTTTMLTFAFPTPSPGLHVVTVVKKLSDQTSAPSTISYVINITAPPPTSCSYAPPGSQTIAQRPLFSADPVNGSIQGFNPIANQAARIAQLRAWGWKVEWQFVDGSPRADKVDRLFLMIWCMGVPQ